MICWQRLSACAWCCRRERREAAYSAPPHHRPVDPAAADCAFTRLGDEYTGHATRSEEHTSELQSRPHLVCRLLLEKKKKKKKQTNQRIENKKRRQER